MRYRAVVAYVLVATHAVILVVGGHWTYARVPAGDWVRDALHRGAEHRLALEQRAP